MAAKKSGKKIIFWTPAEKLYQQESLSSKKEIIFYTPPQTPQEAIDAGLIRTTAEKPKNYVPHNKRLSYGSPALPGWVCIWGCCGSTLAPFDKNWPGTTHDYYCPYWEMLELFPEWKEDFHLKPFHRPVRPKKEKKPYPPLNEWNTNDETANYHRQAAIASAEERDRKVEIFQTRAIDRDSPANSKLRKRKSSRGLTRTKATNRPVRKADANNGDEFTITDDKPRKSRRNKSRDS